MTSTDERPGFPADDLDERDRYYHHLEWAPPGSGWEYKSTRVNESDHPNGWDPTPPEGWELNVDRWPLYDEEEAGWTRVGPGVLRSPSGQLVAHWRRKR